MRVLHWRADAAEAILTEAAEALAAGEIILYPTDTTYALGVDATNRDAVEKLFARKGRDRHKPMSACFHTLEEIARYSAMDAAHRHAAARLLPGPVTLLVPRKPSPLDAICAGSEHLAARIPDHDFMARLRARFAAPITATSANFSGKLEAVTAEEALELAEEIALDGPCVLDGATRHGRPSTILKMNGAEPEILRQGALDEAVIARLLG